MAITDKLLEEMKLVPAIATTVGILIVTVFGLVTDHASGSEVHRLEQEFSGMQYAMEYNHLDNSMRTTKTDLFNLSEKILDMQSRNVVIDRFYRERLEELGILDKLNEEQMRIMLEKHGGPPR